MGWIAFIVLIITGFGFCLIVGAVVMSIIDWVLDNESGDYRNENKNKNKIR